MAATTQIICKISDTATSTVVYESDVTGQINGIIIPNGKLEANKTYKVELFQNTPENATDFKLQLSGTFSTTAWKVEYPTTIPWASISGAPALETLLTKADLNKMASKEDLKNKASAKDLEDLQEEVKQLKQGGGSGSGGAPLDKDAIKNIVTEITYNKETLDRKFTEVGGLAGGDQYATLKKLREWLKPAGITIPLTKEEYEALGWKGHSTINLLFKLNQGGSYGPAMRGLVIELEKLGNIYVKYATIAPDSQGKDKYDIVVSTADFSQNDYAPVPPKPNGYAPDGMTAFSGVIHAVKTYDNGNYYLPYLPLMKKSEANATGYLYYMGTTPETTYSITLTCPDRVKTVKVVAGATDRWSSRMELSIAYDTTKVMDAEARTFTNAEGKATWTVNNPA